MLTRKQPLPRSGRLRPVSAKQGAANRVKRKMYADCLDGECFTCGPACSLPLTPSHILTQKQHPKHRANPDNVVAECWPMHMLWEHNKAEYARQYPGAFGRKMKRMRKLEPQAYAFFRMKNPTLFPPDA